MAIGRKKALILCYIGTLILSFNPIFAKGIALSAVTITFWRTLLAAIVLFGYAQSKQLSLVIQPQHRMGTLLMGSCMGLHLATFFYAIQTSTVALAVISLFTFPAITAVLEPIMFKEKMKRSTLVLALLIIGAIIIVMPELNWESKMTQGVLWGLLSAVFYALRNVLTRRYAMNYPIVTVMSWQLTVSTVIMLPFMVGVGEWGMRGVDVGLLMILGLINTPIGHTLFAASFKQLSAARASVISAIQPVLSIGLGCLILGEIPSLQTMLGGALVLGLIGWESWRQVNSA